MLPNAGPFKTIEVSATTIIIHEYGIGNTVSSDRATSAPLVRIAERQDAYTANEPVYKRYEKVDAGEGGTTTEEFTDTPLQ